MTRSGNLASAAFAEAQQVALEQRELQIGIVTGRTFARCNGRFEIKREPVEHACFAGPRRGVGQQHEVERERSGKNRVATLEVDLELHRVSEPAAEIHAVPSLL